MTTKLTERHVLKVWSPLVGEHHLLHWYTDYERGHVAVARDIPAMEKLWAVVLREYSDVVLKNYYRARIVSPPLSIRARFAMQEHEREVSNFRFLFTC